MSDNRCAIYVNDPLVFDLISQSYNDDFNFYLINPELMSRSKDIGDYALCPKFYDSEIFPSGELNPPKNKPYYRRFDTNKY